MCARAHPLLACLLELRQGKLQFEACWSNVGQAVGSKVSIGRLYTSEYLWASMVPTVVVCDAVRLHVMMHA